MTTDHLSPTQNADPESGGQGASGFAIYWFGIPMMVIVLALLIRLQCGAE